MIHLASYALNILLLAGIGLWVINHRAKAKKAAVEAFFAAKSGAANLKKL